MKPDKLDHIGIAVRDLASAKQFYEQSLGLKIDHEERFQDMRIAFVPIGGTTLELIESTTSDGVIARFIERRGEGIHHLAYRVSDIEALLGTMKKQGVRLIDEASRPGAHGTRVAFIHPKSANGVLTELVYMEKED